MRPGLALFPRRTDGGRLQRALPGAVSVLAPGDTPCRHTAAGDATCFAKFELFGDRVCPPGTEECLPAHGCRPAKHTLAHQRCLVQLHGGRIPRRRSDLQHELVRLGLLGYVHVHVHAAVVCDRS